MGHVVWHAIASTLRTFGTPMRISSERQPPQYGLVSEGARGIHPTQRGVFDTILPRGSTVRVEKLVPYIHGRQR